MRPIGVGLLSILAVHACVHPDGPWVLLASCDVAAAATAIGLTLGWHRIVGVAFLFQVAVGMPAFLVGLITTYVPTATGVAIHLLPPAAGALTVTRRGLPRFAPLIAFSVYLLVLASSYRFAPPSLNVNLVHQVWPPLARLYPIRILYSGFFLGGPLLLLVVGELGLRRAFNWARAPSPQRPRDNA
jgi:hypothetical protein